MAREYRSYSLVEALMKRTRLPRFWAISAVTALLLLFLILMMYFDGTLAYLLDWRFWRDNTDGIFLITYILAVYPFMGRLRQRAIQAFRPLLPLDENAFNRLAAEVSRPSRRWEWTSMFLGIAFSFGLGQPWNLTWEPGVFWLNVYLVIVTIVMFCLLGWLIYDTLAGTARISRLSRQDLKLDILDTELLAPIARWSLGISLAFVGGISLSLVFQTQENLLGWNSITIYAVLVCVTMLIFFLSMWSAHRAMSEAKKRKLALARKHLVAVSRELENRTEQGQLGGMEELSSTVTSWATYQRLVHEAPTWPFNAGILRRLLASIIIPAIVYLIKILSGLGLRL